MTKKTKNTSSKQIRKTKAVEPPQVAMTDTCEEWFLYFSPNLKVVAEGKELQASMSAIGRGGYTAVVKTGSDSVIVPREGKNPDGKKSLFFLEIPASVHPIPLKGETSLLRGGKGTKKKKK
jgi:hypothetical protein